MELLPDIASREMVVERLLKTEENVHVVLFSSIDKKIFSDQVTLSRGSAPEPKREGRQFVMLLSLIGLLFLLPSVDHSAG